MLVAQNSLGPVCPVPLTVRGRFFLRVWLTMHLDLMAAGLVDFFDFVWHAIEIFCLGTQTALPFRILPRDRPPQDGKLD